jgi:transcriptional regulator GlxA family with amidase domain
VIVSAGVSAGIDMSLHVVERLLGGDLAAETASYMEYHWDRNATGLEDLGM